MSRHAGPLAPFAAVDTADENALLRASLEEAQRRIAELEVAAETDPLTGLPNDRRFRADLGRVVGQAARHGTPAAVLYVDLCGLRGLNAAHGELAGDAALRQVARVLAGLIRSTDRLARLDGGRFALLLDHLDHDSAIDAGERIARCIAADPVDLGLASVPIEATVAATSILPGDTAEDVLLRAERNLAWVKSDG